MARRDVIRLVAKGFIAFLAAALVVSTAAIAWAEGLAAAATGVLGIYLAAVLAFGVFTDRLFAPRVQVAFFAGVAAWAGHGYLSGGGVVDLALLAFAVLVLASQARELV